jgi:exodeoxyribonuclease-3
VDELRQTRPNLVIMGDYNIAHEPIDVYNPDKAKKMSGHLPEEREWLSQWFENGFTDAFRSCHPEMEEYSWWSYRRSNRSFNRGWRIDYHSVSESLKDKIVDCRQLTDAVHSDHCPVLLELRD